MNTNKSSTYGNKIIWFVAALLLAVLTITAVLKGGGVSPGELATEYTLSGGCQTAVPFFYEVGISSI